MVENRPYPCRSFACSRGNALYDQDRADRRILRVPKMRTQTYSLLQQCIYVDALRQNEIYEMPEVRKVFLAEEGYFKGLIGLFFEVKYEGFH